MSMRDITNTKGRLIDWELLEGTRLIAKGLQLLQKLMSNLIGESHLEEDGNSLRGYLPSGDYEGGLQGCLETPVQKEGLRLHLSCMGGPD